ncbi:hypothetical protein CN230_28180 [Sinorhizobium meliloti]|nr:hypothetical protein CN230_28180 [Sinorhizobium meliloti]
MPQLQWRAFFEKAAHVNSQAGLRDRKARRVRRLPKAHGRHLLDTDYEVHAISPGSNHMCASVSVSSSINRANH